MQIIIERSKRKSKKGKFAIQLNEQGRSKYYLKRLRYLLSEKYPFLKQECPVLRDKSIKAAKAGDFIIFGHGKKYDYTTINEDTFAENDNISDKLLIINLEEGWKLVKKTVLRYVQKNYPSRVPSKKKNCYSSCPFVQQGIPYGTAAYAQPVRTRTLTVAPATTTRYVVKTRQQPRDWDVKVHSNYVALTNGSQYDWRRISGNNRVSIDGVSYIVRRDSCGSGILVR